MPKLDTVTDLGFTADKIAISNVILNALTNDGEITLSIGYVDGDGDWNSKGAKSFKFTGDEFNIFVNNANKSDFSEVKVVIDDIIATDLTGVKINTLILETVYPFVKYQLVEGYWRM